LFRPELRSRARDRKSGWIQWRLTISPPGIARLDGPFFLGARGSAAGSGAGFASPPPRRTCHRSPRAPGITEISLDSGRSPRGTQWCRSNTASRPSVAHLRPGVVAARGHVGERGRATSASARPALCAGAFVRPSRVGRSLGRRSALLRPKRGRWPSVDHHIGVVAARRRGSAWLGPFCPVRRTLLCVPARGPPPPPARAPFTPFTLLAPALGKAPEVRGPRGRGPRRRARRRALSSSHLLDLSALTPSSVAH